MATDTNPQPSQEDVERTIDEESEVDEASFESFPASDAPGWIGDRAMRAAPDGDDAEEDESGESR